MNQNKEKNLNSTHARAQKFCKIKIEYNEKMFFFMLQQ